MSVNLRYVVSVPAHNGDYVNFEHDMNDKERVIISICGEGWSVHEDDLIKAVKAVTTQCYEK